MADCLYVADTPDFSDARFFRGSPPDHEINRGSHIPQRLCGCLRRVAFHLERYDGFASDTFDRAARQPPVRVLRNQINIGSDQLKLDSRAAAVENKYIHLCPTG